MEFILGTPFSHGLVYFTKALKPYFPLKQPTPFFDARFADGVAPISEDDP